MHPHIKATESELEILNILWREGPVTVRQVHEALSATKEAGYTTTLKLMQIMLEKNLVSRDASRKVHVYTAAIDQGRMKGQIVQRMIDNVFSGSAMQLVMQALGNQRTSPEEIEMIKQYLDEKQNIAGA